MFIILVYLLSTLFQDPPRLYVVAARDTVMPGEMVTITITQFGEVGPVAFSSGGLQVLTDTLSLPTRYVWLRASGPPRDVVITARAGALSDEAIIRICCAKAPDAVNPARRVFMPVFRH